MIRIGYPSRGLDLSWRFGVLTMLVSLACAAPDNDHLHSASTIPAVLPASADGNNIGASYSGRVSMVGSPAKDSDVWYTWTAPLSGPVNFDVEGPEGTLWAVVPNGHFIASKYGSHEFALPVTAGTEYQIIVFSTERRQGDLTIRLTAGDPTPGNDDFANAAQLDSNLPAAIQGSNRGASAEPGEPITSTSNSSVWWKWTCDADAAVQVDAGYDFDLPDSESNGYVRVFTGSDVADLTEVAVGQEQFLFTASAGTEYHIAFSSPPGFVDGDVEILMASFTDPASPNDDFADRIDLGSSWPLNVAGNTVGASVETFDYSVPTRGTVWYLWDPPQDGFYFLSAESEMHTEVVRYQRNELGFPVKVPQQHSETYAPPGVYELFAGNSYQFAVVAIDPQSGIFNLTAELPPLPANDDFDQAISLGSAETTSVGGSTTLATTQPGEPAHTVVNGGGSIWWRWVAPRNGVLDLTLDAEFRHGNPVVQVYQGNQVDALTSVGSDSIRAIAGEEYHIAVSGSRFNAHGDVTLSLNLRPQLPANDWFIDRIPLDPDGNITVSGSFYRAGLDPGEPDHAQDPFFYGSASVWWSWTPSYSGVATISSDFYLPIAVYTGDDLADLVNIGTADSPDRIQLPVTAGQTYAIAAAGYDHCESQFSFDLGLATAPENDLFENPTDLGSASEVLVQADIDLASVEPGEPLFSEDYTATQSIWWTWTAPADGDYNLNLYDMNGEMLLAVFTGTELGSLATVAVSQEYTTKLRFTAAAGTQYRFAAANPYHQEELPAFRLYLTPAPVAPANDDIDSALDLGNAISLVHTSNNFGANPSTGIEGNLPATYYAWTAPAAGNYRISVEGLGRIPSFGIQTSVGGEPLAHSSDAARVISLALGQEIVIEIFNYAYYSDYQLVIDPETDPAPANDDFIDRIDLGTSDSFQVSSSNHAASAEPGEPDHFNQAARDSLWWQWTAATGGRYEVWLLNGNGAPSVNVYRGNVLSELSPHLSVRSISRELGTELTTFDALPGETFQIAVASEYASIAGGEFQFQIAHVPVPENDDFANAIRLEGTRPVAVGHCGAATVEAGEPEEHSPVLPSVWYSWRAPVSGDYRIRTSGYGVPHIYTGEDVASLQIQRYGYIEAQAGVDYKIGVYGDGHFSIEFEPYFKVANALNDSIEDRIVLPGEVTEVATTGNGTNWWEWTPPETGYYSFGPHAYELRIHSTTASGELEVVAATSEPRTFGGNFYQKTDGLIAYLNAGTSYYLETLNFLKISKADPATNDDFADRIHLTGAAVEVSAGMHLATREVGEPFYLGSPPSNTVWWSWTAPQTGRVKISASDSDADLYQLWLSVYTGETLQSLTPIGVARYSDVEFVATAGETYQISIGSSDQRQFAAIARLGIEQSPDLATPPANDDYANPEELSGYRADFSVDLTTATSEVAELGTYDPKSVWFEWTAPADGVTRIQDYSNTPRIEVFKPQPEGEPLLVTRSIVGTPPFEHSESFVLFQAQAGTRYLFRISSDFRRYFTLQGELHLSLSETTANWAARFGLAGAATDADADPDGDSLTNQAERFMGLDPATPDPDPFQVGGNSNQLAIDFPYDPETIIAPGENIDAFGSRSHDLLNWTSQLPTTSESNNTLRVTLPIEAHTPRGQLRVEFGGGP